MSRPRSFPFFVNCVVVLMLTACSNGCHQEIAQPPQCPPDISDIQEWLENAIANYDYSLATLMLSVEVDMQDEINDAEIAKFNSLNGIEVQEANGILSHGEADSARLAAEDAYDAAVGDILVQAEQQRLFWKGVIEDEKAWAINKANEDIAAREAACNTADNGDGTVNNVTAGPEDNIIALGDDSGAMAP